MKLLPDGQMPREVSELFPGVFTVVTVQDQGLGGVRNGELSRRAAEAGFDALVTGDKNIEYQQNVADLALTVVVTRPIRIRVQDLSPSIPDVVAALREGPARAFVRMEPRTNGSGKG